MSRGARADVVSSFTLIKGAMVDETWTAMSAWDLDRDVTANLADLGASNPFGATGNWLRDVHKVLHRRIDPVRDRPLIELAKAGLDREAWRPLLLWHITRDEFLLREFLTSWAWDAYADGAYRLNPSDVVGWLQGVERERGLSWAESTRERVASGLLRAAADFGLLAGTVRRRFTAYHLPEASLLYLLHAMAEVEPNAHRLVHLPDWRMYRMRPDEVEGELLRLHQFRRVHYDVAGSLSQLKLPAPSLSAWATAYAAKVTA